MTTGQRIKAARKKAGLTQRELGAKIGVAYQTLAQWENDLRNPKYETLERISEALGVPLAEICSQDRLKNYEIVKRQSALSNQIKDVGDVLEKYALALQQAHAIEILGGKRIERIVYALDKLNDEGQQEAVKRVEELTEIPKYQKAKEPPHPE